MSSGQVKAATKFWRDRCAELQRELANGDGVRRGLLLQQENAALVEDVRRLTGELNDLRRLCALQQRRIDGYEAEHGPRSAR